VVVSRVCLAEVAGLGYLDGAPRSIRLRLSMNVR
jgi:hypothetical protein